ncbi:MAG: UvrD-helicase domain-containing protein [Fervidobacterium sp.]
MPQKENALLASETNVQSQLSQADIVRKNVNCNYFISASAGTGKTYTLTNYYIGILEYWEKFNKPDIVDNILAVTFTNKAANEMKERIMNEVNKKIQESQEKKQNKIEYWKNVYSNISRAIISTIDSLCRRLLIEQNIIAGVDPNFTIINELKQLRIIDNVIRYTIELSFQIYEGKDVKFRTTIPKERISKLEKYVSELKTHKDAILEFFERVGNIELVRIYMADVVRNWRLELNSSKISEKLFEVLRKAGASMHVFRNMCLIASELYEAETLDNFEYDFKGVLEKVLEILEDDSVRKYYQERFKYIIVDEFQDTNELQRKLFEMLHNDENYIFYVGDRKQSIYRFRGADVSVFIRTMNKFEELRKVYPENYMILALQKNFRSHKTLVNYFNEISRNAIFSKYITEENTVTDQTEDKKLYKTFYYEVFKERFPQLYNKLFFLEEDVSQPSNLGYDNETLPTISYVKNNEKINEEHELKRVVYLNATTILKDSSETEALIVAQTIKDIVGKEMTFFERVDGTLKPVTRKIDYHDITILTYRLSNIENVYREVFSKFNIPLYVVKGRSFYKKPEIRSIVSALNVIQNPNNNYNFMEFFFTPFFEDEKISQGFDKFKVFNKIVTHARKLKEKDGTYSLYQAAKSLATEGSLPQYVSNMIFLIEKYDELKYFLRPAEVLKNFIKESNYLGKLAKFEDTEQKLKNVKKLLDKSPEFNQQASSFLELTRLFERITELQETEASELSEESNVVRLMTIHASKGLEFNIVFLVQNNYSERDEERVAFPFDEEDRGRYIHIKKFLEKFEDEIDKSSEEYKELIKQLEAESVFDETELLRKMYVGVTRAKELIFIVTLPDGRRDSSKTAKKVFERMPLNEDRMQFIKKIDLDGETLEHIAKKLSEPETITTPENKTINEDKIKEQIVDLSHVAYKRYISPTLLYGIKDEKSSVEDPRIYEENYEDYYENINKNKYDDITNFVEDKTKSLLDASLETLEGKIIHRRLMSVNEYEQLVYLAENEKIPKGILKADVIKWLFNCDKILSEFRLAKHFELEGKKYILFGVPDKVFIKNNKMYVVDFKNSFLSLEGTEIEKYKFQMKFYMYLLKDLGEIGGGYIISTKNGFVIRVDVPDDSFKNEIIRRIKLFESIENININNM